jgi:hypothetical protein
MQLTRKKSVFPLLLCRVTGKMAGEIIDMKIEPNEWLHGAAVWAAPVSFGVKVDDEMGSRYEEATMERRSVAVDHFAPPYVCMCFCSEPLDSDVLHAWQSSV